MIEAQTESVISLATATKHLPARRGGKRPHVSCLYRWTTVGCRGVVLESIQIGGTRCTSHEALARFFARLTRGMNVDVPRSVAQRERATDHAMQALEREGL